MSRHSGHATRREFLAGGIGALVLPSATAHAQAESESLSDVLTPFDFEARGDGFQDDYHPLMKALESGKIVDGLGRTYAVSGTLKPAAGTARGIKNCKFKQLVSTIPTPDQGTVSIGSPAIVTLNDHRRAPNSQVMFTTTGALPAGLAPGAIYYVLAGAELTQNTFRVSATAGGAAIDTSGSQSGTHTISSPNRTLWFADQNPGLIVENCEFDLNSDHVTGRMNTRSGESAVRVERCERISIKGNRIHNGGPCTATYFNEVSGEVSGNTIEDLTFVFSRAPDDEVICGATVSNCPDLLVFGNRFSNFSGTIGGVASLLWTVGMIVGGSGRSKLLYNIFDHMTSGIALAGENHGVHIIGTTARVMGSIGVKATNLWSGITIAGSHLEECGLAGIFLSRRQTEDFTFELEPHDASVYDNYIKDTGSNGQWAANGSGPSGIIIDIVPEHGHHPQGVKIHDNVIVDEQMATCTMTIASPCVITMVAHGKFVGEEFTFPGTTGAFPTGITAASSAARSSSIKYYVTSKTDDAFTFAETPSGVEITTSGAQGGTHYCSKSTMKWGIFTLVTGSSQEDDVNIAINNRIKGAKTAETSGIANYSSLPVTGSFTPVFTASTPPTGVTYGHQVGTYTKVGRIVYFNIALT